jgi:nucleoside-diphosphate-sugar epimerase
VAAGERPGRRAINSGDPDPRNVLGICHAVTEVMEHGWEVIDIGTPPNETLGVTPWTTPHSITLDLSIGRDELGWSGSAPYDTWLADTCDWLLDVTKGRPWQEVLPRAATYYGNLFDYAAEDGYLTTSRRQ